jgi:hypothetical protein
MAMLLEQEEEAQFSSKLSSGGDHVANVQVALGIQMCFAFCEKPWGLFGTP